MTPSTTPETRAPRAGGGEAARETAGRIRAATARRRVEIEQARRRRFAARRGSRASTGARAAR